VRFLVDAQLPVELSQLLEDQGHVSEHVLELGLAQSKDRVLWEYAAEFHAIIVTKDEDFADWIVRGKAGASVVWLRIGNCTNTALLVWFTARLPQIIDRLDRQERLVEVR
jgi:predicted nuclease of predicted toxin-antitoxin system